MCTICYSAESDVIFFPCKHLVVDIECYRTILKNKKEQQESSTNRNKQAFKNECVMCRKPIDYVFHLK